MRLTESRRDLRLRLSSTATWTSHLADVENHLRLLKARPGMLTTSTMPEYIYARTKGVVGLLERLIEDGCTEAITSGTERLT